MIRCNFIHQQEEQEESKPAEAPVTGFRLSFVNYISLKLILVPRCGIVFQLANLLLCMLGSHEKEVTLFKVF